MAHVPPEDLDRRRQRRTRHILVAGGVLSLTAGLAAGVAGLTGRAGMVLLLLVASLTCTIAAVHALGAALVDEVRGHEVTRRRPIIGVGLLLAAGVLMAMVGSAAAE